MKRFLLLLTFVIYSSSFGQNIRPNIVTESRYSSETNNWEPYQRTYYYYNDEMVLLRKIQFSWKEEGWSSTIQVDYDYDEKGRNISETTIKLDGEAPANLYKTRTRYVSPDKNLIANEKDQRYENDQWIDEYQRNYSYDNQDLLTSIEYQQSFGTQWSNTMKEDITHNDNGEEDLRKLFMWMDNAYQESSQTSSSYNEAGKLASQLVEVKMGTDWTPFQKVETAYSENNQPVERVDSRDNVGADYWEPIERLLTEYDENLLMVQQCKDTAGNYPSNLSKAQNDLPDNSQNNIEVEWVHNTMWTYSYEAITSIDSEGNLNLPMEFKLLNNYPNPFNPSTTISYILPQSSFVTLKVFDVLGNEVAELVNESKVAGKHEVIFNADNLSSGAYFYVLQTDRFTETKKIMLVK